MIVGGIRDEVALLGANDSEIPTINELLEKLRRNELSPEEAVRLAKAIRDRKADYH